MLDHELKISKDMEELTTYLPHFNAVLEIVRNVPCRVPENLDKMPRADFNPFRDANCFRDVSISEYIPSTTTLLDFVKKNGFKDGAKALIHQLVLGLFIAQQAKNFCHYDLHMDNVLIRKCTQRTFFWYKFAYQGVVLNRMVYTGGHFPVVFDYGSAYSTAVLDTSYNNSLFFTHKGYTPYTFDETVDFRTLLVRLTNVRGCPEKIKNMVAEHFTNVATDPNFKVDKKTGWLVLKRSSCSRKICEYLESHLKALNVPQDSFVRSELDGIVDLLGILVRPPFGDGGDFETSTDLRKTVEVFVREWSKIDEWFSSPDDKLNILKNIFLAINRLIVDSDPFLQSSTTIIQPDYKKLRSEIYNVFDEFGDFVAVEDLDCETFTTAILDMSNLVESFCSSDAAARRQTLKDVSFPSAWTLLAAVEQYAGSQRPYKFKQNDSVVLFDAIEKSTSSFDLTDDAALDALNQCFDSNAQMRFLDSLQMID